MRSLSTRLVVAIMLVLIVATGYPLLADQTPRELIPNPSFSGSYMPLRVGGGKGQVTGAMAPGWHDNSAWADVTVAYAEETKDTHGTGSAQKVTIASIRSGSAQFVADVTLTPGHIYSSSAWFKGQSGELASISLRQGGAPYTTYAKKVVALTGNWQQVKLIGTVPMLAKDALPSTGTDYFMVHPPVGSSLLVDDASVIDVTDLVSDKPAIVGNLLPDASFEAGFSAGWDARVRMQGPLGGASAATDSQFIDPRPVIDSTGAYAGKQSMKMTLPAPGTVEITSPLLPYNFGRPYTASMWLRSDIPGSSASIKIDGSPDVKYIGVNAKWKQIKITTVVPFGVATRIIVGENFPVAGSVWIDDAQLVEGSDVAPVVQPALELGLSVDRAGSIFYDGEPAVLRLATANTPPGSKVRLTCLDLYGNTVALPSFDPTATSITIAPNATRPRGMFKVTAQVVDSAGAPIGPSVQQVFARLPKPQEIVPEQSYFGVHIPLTPRYFEIARAIGARWTRIHDANWATVWPVVESTRGTFNYIDDGIFAAKKAGIAVLGMLDGGPPWASVKLKALRGYSSTYNHVDAPDAVDAWKNYVSNVVTHYAGTVDYWEVWNEPWGRGFSPGSAEVYGNLLKEAYPVAKKANPKATIIGIDTSFGYDKFTDDAMRVAGGSTSYDEFSYHEYYSSLYGGPKSQAANDAATWDGLEKKYGKITPRWLTECAPWDGVQSLYWPIGDEQATRFQYAELVRFEVTAIANGVRHVFYYSLHTDPRYGEVCWFALEHDRSIRPILGARAVLASLVDGAACSGRTEPMPGVDCYTFKQTTGRTVQVVWSFDGQVHTLPLAVGARAIDAIGNPIDGSRQVAVAAEPVYIVK